MLYHYTDFIAFDGIVGHTELRLNNVLNMNDASEMRYYMEGICSVILEKLNERGFNEKARMLDVYFRNELKEEFNYSAYAACFSRYRDDAAQWERYGKDGQGVSIAFDETMLARITDTTNGVVSMRNVHYRPDFSDVDIAEQIFRLMMEHEQVSECTDEFQRLMDEAWITSAAFKHPSFANENEVRMVVSPFVSDAFPVYPKYHVSLGRIKKYYPMNLDELCRRAGITLEDLITEVIIGPTSTQSMPILEDYLRDNGLRRLAEHISVSQCPLRRPTS